VGRAQPAPPLTTYLTNDLDLLSNFQ